MNIIKVTVLIVSVVALSVSSSAEPLRVYVEGQVGFLGLKDLDTRNTTGTLSGLTFTNARGNLEYDRDWAYGAEVGLANLGANDNIRLGLSFKEYEAELDSAYLSGSVQLGGTTYINNTFDNEDFKTVGLDFDNTIRLYSVNAYYDFNDFQPDGALTPFLGVGIGIADIENSKSDDYVLNLSAGVNYALTEQYYWGLRADFHRVSGPKDKLGLEYQTIYGYSVMLALGYRF